MMTTISPIIIIIIVKILQIKEWKCTTSIIIIIVVKTLYIKE